MRRVFAGKRVLITGGSKGIGLALARELSRRGARLALLARDPGALEAAKAEIEAAGGSAAVFSCDVTDAEALGRAVAGAAAALGGLDGVIANSGYCHPGYFHEITPEDLSRQIDTNLKGVAYTLHYAVPELLKQDGGFIAITSSPAGNAGIFGFSIYGATKAALNNLADTLRYEYADRNISVHLLLPPDTQTPGYDQEVLLYPPETRAVLQGGKLFPPEAVARRFAEALERGRKQATIGFETHLLLWVRRLAPCLWDAYTAWRVRSARK